METTKAQRVIPDFATEAEEAKWWFEHQDELLEDFEQAAAEGRLSHGTAARLGNLPTIVHFRLDPEDLSMARAQAAQRGLKVEAYLEQLVHEALRNAKE
jgi:predicted DNA binding CopG/RHH family protein